MSAPVVTIFKNGDNHFQGKRLVINPKEIRNFDALLDKITTDTRSKTAVRSLRTPNHGHRVDNVEKLENGGVYVAVGPEKFRKLRYNEIRALPINRQKSEGQAIKPVIHSRVVVSGRARKVAAAEPLSNRIIQVYRNGDEMHSSIKLLLDKRILKSMDNVLQYISDKVNLRTGAVRSLYSMDGVMVENSNQIESGQKYVAVGFGRKFVKVHYHDGSQSLTPRRARTKNSYSPDRPSKRGKPRRLRTHPLDKQSTKRESKVQSSNGSTSQDERTQILSNKSSGEPSPRDEADSGDSPGVNTTPSSRKSSTNDNGAKTDPFHSSKIQKNDTFSKTDEAFDPADIVDTENETKEDDNDDVFKATGNQGEKAKAVRDDDDTQTEKPIDMQAAEEVEEEVIEDAVETNEDANEKPETTGEAKENINQATTDDTPIEAASSRAESRAEERKSSIQNGTNTTAENEANTTAGNEANTTAEKKASEKPADGD